MAFAATVAAAPCSAAAAGESDSHPAPLAVALVEEVEWPSKSADVMGWRFNFLFGRHAGVFGLDTGIFGCGVDGNLFGLQLSGCINDIYASSGAIQFAGIANSCTENFNGCQLAGIANTCDADVKGGQLAIFNNAKGVTGAQVGVFNQCQRLFGVQIGLINTAGRLDGFGLQLGVVNTFDYPKRCIPILNMGF